MKHHLSLAEDFGPRLADGAEASQYRHARIEPYVAICDEMELDFTGVRSANSSFVNALLAAIFEHHGEAALQKFVFKGCNPLVRVLVEGAIDLGLQKAEGRAHA